MQLVDLISYCNSHMFYYYQHRWEKQCRPISTCGPSLLGIPEPSTGTPILDLW